MNRIAIVLLAAAPLGAGADAQDSATIGDLEIKVAEGWKVQKAGDWTQLVPPGVASVAEACAALRDGIAIEGTWWAAHKKFWNGLRDELGFKDIDAPLLMPDGPGDFIASSGRWGREGQGPVNIRIYTARAGRSLVGVVYTGQDYGAWSLRTWPLERMLRGAVVKGAPARTPPKVVEAFQCVNAHTTYHANGRTTSTIRNDRMVLFDNGMADVSLLHDAGYDGFPLWKVDADLDDGSFGRWKKTGDEVHLTKSGRTEVCKREGDNLRLGGQVWKPMLKMDGLRLVGRFARKSDPGAVFAFSNWIEFSADGKVAMEGILWSPIVDGNPVKVPEKGKGTYEIGNWTLNLKLDGGFAQSQDILILEGDVKNPDAIWLRGLLYPRER